MMLHVLAGDGDEVDCTDDVPPETWAADFKIAKLRRVGITADNPDRVLFQAEILLAINKIVRTADDAPDAVKVKVVRDLMHKSCFYWITGVLDEFDERSKTEDGFVKIFDDHVEWGWMPRRDPNKLN